ncbi:Hypothetical_protein [Hexamita inflata]|uniref:Hypothetical_protein n=1 Tax=Hexamita inflata TaxID=28002 RepID=A0AA86NM61_9EUKA|nr:Hypothetical protein HINF_LOCUS9203 [Hexamita inflata]
MALGLIFYIFNKCICDTTQLCPECGWNLFLHSWVLKQERSLKETNKQVIAIAVCVPLAVIFICVIIVLAVKSHLKKKIISVVMPITIDTIQIPLEIIPAEEVEREDVQQ